MGAQWGTIYTVQPGAAERIQAKLKNLKEINENRPCYKCKFKFRGDSPSKYFRDWCTTCNFNHDKFEPLEKETGVNPN